MTIKVEPRPYQPKIIQRMVDRRKVLLAAQQGTGKTYCSVAAIEWQFDNEMITVPGLIVCLSTLKDQWAEKIQEYTEGTSTSLIIPGGEASAAKRKDAFKRAADWEADYVILHYEQVVNYYDEVAALPRGFMIVDEASFIRGFRAARSKSVKSLGRTCPVRYGLTGTPIENGKPEECYSIMEFVDPDVFGRHELFDRTYMVRNSFGGVSRYRNIPTFHKVLGAAMIRLRADDPEVAPFMPSTAGDREPVKVRLDPAGREVYNHIAKELLADLTQASSWGGSFNVNVNYGWAPQSSGPRDVLRGRIGQKLMALQMLCNHPDLLRLSAARYADTNGTKGSAYLAKLSAAGLFDKLGPAPKLQYSLRWLKERLALDDANKIVLFTTFVDMALILAEEIGATASLYTGRLNAKEKTANLTRFQTVPKCRVLVATDAGGYGLDIPQANYLLNYDLPDGGAGLADQRDTRIVRTSSQFAEVSRNWAQIKGSIEEYKLAQLNQDRAIRDAFVDARGLTHKGGVSLTADSLASFLRSNAV